MRENKSVVVAVILVVVDSICKCSCSGSYIVKWYFPTTTSELILKTSTNHLFLHFFDLDQRLSAVES